MAESIVKQEIDVENANQARKLKLQRLLTLGALCVVFVLAAYSNSLHNSFHFDDSHAVVNNLYIRSLSNIPRFFTDALTASAYVTNSNYRPLVTTTLAIDYWLGGGLDPVWFHITQLTLLIATGVLLFVLYRRLFSTARSEAWHVWAALFAATLFCVHTGNTQVANYITVRSELLSGLGVLGAFAIYIYVPTWRRYHVYLLPVIVGATAKTPAVMFAPLLLAYLLLIEEQLSMGEVFSRTAWRAVRRAVLRSLPAFGLAAILYVFVEWMNPPSQAYGGVGRLQYFATQTWVWIRYLRIFFVPTGLSADPDMHPLAGWLQWRTIPGLLFFALSIVAIWRASRTRDHRPVAFGIAWFWIALVPGSSVFPLAEVTNDHRAFFPYMGLTAAVVWWICITAATANLSATVRRRLPQFATVAAILILVVHAVGTYRRNRVWLSEETLWSDVVKKNPTNGRGLMNYGVTQMRIGRLNVAKDYFTRALAYTPNYASLHINLGAVEDALGDSVASEAWFQRAVAIDSTSESARRFYAGWLTRHGRAPEAVAQLRKALQLSAADVEARHELLALYAAQGDTASLKSLALQVLANANDPIALEYSETLARGPTGTSAEWFKRGLDFAQAGRHVDAAYAYGNSATLDSANADALNNLGWTRGKLGFFIEAVPPLETAVRLRPDYTLAKNNLAWCRSGVAGDRFRRAFALQTTGHSETAIPIYRDLLAADPAWTNAHYNLGYALMTVGNCRDAVNEFERTLALQPDYPLAHLHLSTCYQRLGNTIESKRHRAAYEGSQGAPTGGAAKPVR